MYKTIFLVIIGYIFLSTTLVGQSLYAIKDQVSDKFIPADYHNSEAKGYLAERMEINAKKRLLRIDLESILSPYKHRPGVQEWTGEHVGKFLHAASLEYQNSGDTVLRRRMDYVAQSLIATQLPDGYLGTYLEKERWTSWDVWSHKYNLIGLLAYYKVTGYEPALSSCKKMADLLCETFGKGKKDIIKSGTHVGMAPTSILEPMVELYRFTGESRYLGFCNYILDSWEEDGGPKIISSLLKTQSVFKTANAKSYEMMSDLVGLLELYRLTGIEKYLKVVQNAWLDIVVKRLYLHGTTSHTEHFQDDFDLNPGGYYGGTKYCGPGEGCVTVTWIQLNSELLRLTGEQKYIQQLEGTVYNSLLAAQNPNNGEICYFLPLNGRKRYGEVTHGILPDICCCSSSIPRGIALIPQLTGGAINNSPTLLLYSSGIYKTKATLENNEVDVEFNVNTNYPVSGKISIDVKSSQKSKYTILLNVPSWSDNYTAAVNGDIYIGKAGTFLPIERNWNLEDRIQVNIKMVLKIIPDNNKGSKLVAVKRGPQILALDENIKDSKGLPQGWSGNQIYKFTANQNGIVKNFMMVPLAEAGQTMADYTVLIDNIRIVEEKETASLQKYREQLTQLRKEFRAVNMPDIKFFLFGMGNRTKLLYKDGKLMSALNGAVIKEWPVKNETIIPNDYRVNIETLTDVVVSIYENEKGVFVNELGKETLIEGTSTPLTLPSFGKHQYNEVLKVLNHEILINILDSKPLPNFFVYKKPWRRDGAMMAMCLVKTDNTNLIKNWVLSLNEPYDRNNAGETEADNLGQTLYLLSLFADKKHPLVKQTLAEIQKYEVNDSHGRYIKGRSDFHEAPVYQTKWLKFGLHSLGIKESYTIPKIQDNYSSLFWWDYKDSYMNGTKDAYDQWKDDKYPYIGWAADHFHGMKRNPVSNRDYPLTWEIQASQADYKGMSIIDEEYVKAKNSSPHTWHAAEMFLYLISDKFQNAYR
jgi:DUF1680 family protein